MWENIRDNVGIWILVLLVAALFGIGIFCMVSKQPRTFTMKLTLKPAEFEVHEVKKYNIHIGSLWIIYGVVLGIFAYPLLIMHIQLGIIIFLLGALVTSFILSWFSIKTEEKYRR